MAFYEYPPKSWDEVLPHASEEARDLVRGLVTYQSTDRLTAVEVGSKWHDFPGPTNRFVGFGPTVLQRLGFWRRISG